MATFWESLSEASKAKWAGTEECDGKEKVVGIFEKFTGKKWENPTKDERGIKCEPQIEDISEIEKIMKKKPGEE